MRFAFLLKEQQDNGLDEAVQVSHAARARIFPTVSRADAFARHGSLHRRGQAPMAIVIFFGLFTSTLLNMIVVPSAYYRFARRIRAVADKT